MSPLMSPSDTSRPHPSTRTFLHGRLVSFIKSTNQSNSTAHPFLTKIPLQPIPTSAQQRGTAVSVPANLILSAPTLHAPVARAIGHRIFRRTFVLAFFLPASPVPRSTLAASLPTATSSSIATQPSPAMRNPASPPPAPISPGATSTSASPPSNPQFRKTTPAPSAASPPSPTSDYVLHDRIVSAHRLRLQSITPASIGANLPDNPTTRPPQSAGSPPTAPS